MWICCVANYPISLFLLITFPPATRYVELLSLQPLSLGTPPFELWMQRSNVARGTWTISSRHMEHRLEVFELFTAGSEMWASWSSQATNVEGKIRDGRVVFRQIHWKHFETFHRREESWSGKHMWLDRVWPFAWMFALQVYFDFFWLARSFFCTARIVRLFTFKLFFKVFALVE